MPFFIINKNLKNMGKIIYNVTFVVERGDAPAFAGWMRSEGIELLAPVVERGAMAPRLAVVEEVPGEQDFRGQACSFAFQMEFGDIETAHSWGETRLALGLEAFRSRFGTERALSFSTILKEVKL